VTIAANSKLTMKLSAVMAQIQQTALATKWARLAAALGGGRARKEAESVRRLRAALAFVALTIGLALLTAGSIRCNYVTVIAASIFLMVAATESGCGSSSSLEPAVIGSSSESVTQVWVSQSPHSLTVAGVPASMGVVNLVQ